MIKITFTEQELEALYAIIDAALKFNGVQMLSPANMVIQKLQTEIAKQQAQQEKKEK